MKPKLSVVLMSSTTVLILLALMALSIQSVAAESLFQTDPTPGGGLSNFVIPTTTPGGGGGFDIPTVTPGGGGGFVIPTSTSVGSQPPGGGLPQLTENDLEGLNLQSGEVPAEFAQNRNVNAFTLEETVAQIQAAGATDLAKQLQEIGQTYGWVYSKGISYNACQPSVPVSEIYSEVAQLASPEVARRFHDDPKAQNVFTQLGYTITPATSVHGWMAIGAPEEGECFAQEKEYTLTFEYWGMLIVVSLEVNADTDPALVSGLLDQLAATMVAHVNAIAPAPFPATPIPAVVNVPPVPATAVSPLIVPTQAAGPAIKPTSAGLPTISTGGAQLADLAKVMPTIDEVGLPQPTFALNQQYSGTVTFEQMVTVLQNAQLYDMANALQQAGSKNGLIGQEARVWDTGSSCPQTIGLSVEIDVSLYQTAQGAQAQLVDPGMQQAWIGTGLVSSFQQDGNGILSIGSNPVHPCGAAPIVGKSIVHGRFLISLVLIINPLASQQEIQSILSAIDPQLQVIVQKIDQAGLK